MSHKNMPTLNPVSLYSKDKVKASTSLPKVLLVGGPDIDARLELMQCLNSNFEISALGSLPTLRNKFLAEGFDYYFYHLNRRVNPIWDLLTFNQLVQVLSRLKPQIVHTFDTKPGVWGRLAARIAGVPVIIGTLPGLGNLYSNNNFKTYFIRLIYQALQKSACYFSDLTIFQNHDDAEQFVAAGIVSKKKTRIILGSGVSTSLFTPNRVADHEKMDLRDELDIRPNELVVTMISRIIRSKGVLDFMAAAQHIGVQYPNVRFLLVGPEDKDSFDRLSQLELSQLRQSVIWPGSRQDISTILAISDIFVLPSTYREGIPRVLLEAASMELPLITTDSPGCNEILEHDVNGYLIPKGNLEALNQAILNLIKQPELCHRFGQASRQKAVERFDLSVIANQIRSVYNELLAQKALLTAIDG